MVARVVQQIDDNQVLSVRDPQSRHAEVQLRHGRGHTGWPVGRRVEYEEDAAGQRLQQEGRRTRSRGLRRQRHAVGRATRRRRRRRRRRLLRRRCPCPVELDVEVERKVVHGDGLAHWLAWQALHKPRAALLVHRLDLQRRQSHAERKGPRGVRTVVVAHMDAVDRKLHVVEDASEQAGRERAVVALGRERALQLFEQLARQLAAACAQRRLLLAPLPRLLLVRAPLVLVER